MKKSEFGISAGAVVASTIQDLLQLHTARQKSGVSEDKKAKLDELVGKLSQPHKFPLSSECDIPNHANPTT